MSLWSLFFNYFVPPNHLRIPIPVSHCFNYCDFGQYFDYS